MMGSLPSPLLDLLPLAVCWLYLLLCPYTKVEESFNLQATHDVLYHCTDLAKYDHLEFPGVVPRTFIGPLALSALSFPMVTLAKHTNVGSKFTSQILVRAVLGGMVCGAFALFRRAVQRKLGGPVAIFLTLTTCSQFHFLFYASRPLPNTFALILALLCFRCWLLGQHTLFICLSGAAIVWFRFELSILLGIIVIMELLNGRMTVWRTVMTTLSAAVPLLALTVLVDSVLWRRWVWPEGEVLWFNTVKNKSHLWGTLPFLWYFYSALPRCLLFTSLFIPWAIIRDKRRALTLAAPALTFVLVYSLLPHKELRFIVYAIPLLNLVIAMGMANIWLNRSKLPHFAPLLVLSTLCLSLGASLCLLAISRHNYPGGVAFTRLHELMADRTGSGDIKVHIGVEAAMTGVSRFGELEPNWNYSKLEGLEANSTEMASFTFLLISAPDHTHYKDTHEVLLSVEGFSGLSINTHHFPPVKISLQEKILVLVRKTDFKGLRCPTEH
ncbi:dol-P-Man:Man(7)GlcNAc(2)-PP-Dol alpha-1,6-mannosyltransferase-like [Halichondria panicea]|uniref:dol-P-Man:Man(7)GlcNAc(2)-PP-Dol alpha-1,6-mannosyltransferase-like n=1 Tax=Halichondria panicea TaxID=6063 RepID=UPI00312B857E